MDAFEARRSAVGGPQSAVGGEKIETARAGLPSGRCSSSADCLFTVHRPLQAPAATAWCLASDSRSDRWARLPELPFYGLR